MKRILLMLTAFASATSVFAQEEAFYKFERGASPREVHTLGTNPQFPFLQRQTSPHGVYMAIQKEMKREDRVNTMEKFNGILMGAGFANGAADVRESNITAATIPAGTEGNMGSGSMIDGYYRLDVNGGAKAWKITSNSGKYVYFLSACGNAFYPNGTANRSAACITAPVNVTSAPRELTVGTEAAPLVTDRTYVYYHQRRNRGDESYAREGIKDATPSKPLLLSAKKRVEANPQTYRVSVSGPAENVTICPDSAAVVVANVDVEKISAYTGNYPSARPAYQEIKKRAYKRAERKMRHVEKKEAKIGAITGVPVDIQE